MNARSDPWFPPPAVAMTAIGLIQPYQILNTWDTFVLGEFDVCIL